METVDEQMARLGPEDNWRADTTRALAQFRERRGGGGQTVRRWLWAMAAAAIVCAGLLSYPHVFKSGKTAASMRVLSDGAPAPGFDLKDANGANVRLLDYRGRAVVLNFWATWCRPCREEMPMLSELESGYKARGLEVIGISVDDDGWKSVQPFMAKTPVGYPVVIGNADLAKRYGVEAMPMTVLVDRGGRVAGVHLGTVDRAVWESEIGRLLK